MEATKELKYYEVYITGEAKLDPVTKALVKDEQGNVIIAWQRTGRDNPAMKAVMANYDPRFYQCEMVEANLGKDNVTTAGGKTFRIGPLTTKGKTVNVFLSRQREIFKAITEELIAKNFAIIIQPVGGEKPVKPVCKILGYVQPGYHVQFGTGFKFEVWNRDPETHKETQVFQHKYNKAGQLEKAPLIMQVGDLFLFPNELDAMDAHIETAKAALAEHKLKEDLTGNPRTDDVKDTAAPAAVTDDIKPI